MSCSRRVGCHERGVVGGAEALAFGTLILLAGALMTANVWGIVETRVALDAAAREYLRAYTSGSDAVSARDAGERAAAVTLAGRGTPLSGLRIASPDATGFGPCGVATVELTASVPVARVPFLGELASSEVRVTHTELIDAHREVTPHARFEYRDTPCSTS
jgi:hypothetical protein